MALPGRYKGIVRRLIEKAVDLRDVSDLHLEQPPSTCWALHEMVLPHDGTHYERGGVRPGGPWLGAPVLRLSALKMWLECPWKKPTNEVGRHGQRRQCAE